MISPNYLWIDKNVRFNDIIDSNNLIVFSWGKNISEEYILMSDAYYTAAYLSASEIADDYRDNTKCDQWFFSALYLYRQAIELLCKGLMISVFSKKQDATDKMLEYKHNIVDCLYTYFNHTSNCPLSQDELDWITLYLRDLESKDSQSNLFRYPIRDGILANFPYEFLDIVDMINSIDQCYSIIYKCVASHLNPMKYASDIDLSLKPQLLFGASHGIGNCMLYDSPIDNGYYSHIEGYSNTAFYLLNKMQKNQWSFFPIAYLVRHAIELTLKSLMFSGTYVCVDKKQLVFTSKSHTLYQDLWKTVKPVITYYARESDENLSLIDVAESQIIWLSSLDKRRDKFRYPTNYGLIHDLEITKVDFINSIYWMIRLFNFLYGCNAMLEGIKDYESEMFAEYY